MYAMTRWVIAVGWSLIIFAVFFAVFRYWLRAGDAASWAIAGAALTVAVAVFGWWAIRDLAPPSAASTAASTDRAGDTGQAIISNPVVVIGDISVTTHRGQDRSLSMTPVPGRRPEQSGPVVLGEDIPGQPPAFQPRDTLLAPLRDRSDELEVCLVYAVTGMRGTGRDSSRCCLRPPAHQRGMATGGMGQRRNHRHHP